MKHSKRGTHTYVLDPTCVECGAAPKLVTGKVVFPDWAAMHERFFMLCKCGAYVGCHPGGGIPLGRPAGPETRKARQQAHAAFDPIWSEGHLTRRQAYDWLSRQVGAWPNAVHIGWMSRDEALEVVRISAAFDPANHKKSRKTKESRR